MYEQEAADIEVKEEPGEEDEKFIGRESKSPPRMTAAKSMPKKDSDKV